MIERLSRPRTGGLVAGLAMAVAMVAGCAGDPSDGGMDGGGMDGGDMAGGDMAGMAMHDPDATPASELPDTIESTFDLLDTRPPGTDEVAGTAWLALGDNPGTTLTVSVTGLEPGAEFVGHLHAQACADGNGGPHFRFDPDGSELPPNEVHIGFTAGDDGNGDATITNEQPAEGARSVVIHPVSAMDNLLACADF